MRLLKRNEGDSRKPYEKSDVRQAKHASLLYLEEALRREQYEECSEIIKAASGFGASAKEIETILSDYVHHDRSDISPVPQWMNRLEEF